MIFVRLYVVALFALIGACVSEHQPTLEVRLFLQDPTALEAETEEQEAIITWLSRYYDGPITESTLPYVTLGALRSMNMTADVQWTGSGSMLSDIVSQNDIYWNTCAYMVDMFHDALQAFDVPVRPLHNVKHENQTHATAEFYSEHDGWVFVDVFYGAMYFRSGIEPLSFVDVTRGDYEETRFYGPFSTEQIFSPVSDLRQLDDRDYSVISENYFSVTAIRYEDALYKDTAITNPQPTALNRTHKGRWLVLDTSNEGEFDADFWAWFDQRYNTRCGEQYSYDRLRLGEEAVFLDLSGDLVVLSGSGTRIDIWYGQDIVVSVPFRGRAYSLDAAPSC